MMVASAQLLTVGEIVLKRDSPTTALHLAKVE